jgi:hypothetical protein
MFSRAWRTRFSGAIFGGGYPGLMRICGTTDRCKRSQFVSQRETPSLSLRLRSAWHARADSDVFGARSDRVRPRSVCISTLFECGE